MSAARRRVHAERAARSRSWSSSPSSSQRYQLLGRLAVGGMSEVFLARQRARGGFSRLVVVKQLLPMASEDHARRLLDEARVAASVTHENVVTVLDVGSRDGNPFLALEYVHGVAASALLKHAVVTGGQLPLVAVARIVQDAARGLLHAHLACDADGRGLGIVHRDVAPKNILVRKDGIAKIADFGIALARERLSHTATGAVCGTVPYMAPEQARSERLTAKTDQFALGAVLWELLVGRTLFKANTPSMTLRRLLQMPIEPPSTYRNDTAPIDDPSRAPVASPAALDAVVLRMLARNPSDRFPSMAEVIDALEAAVPGVSSDAARRSVAQLVDDIAREQLAARERDIQVMSEAAASDSDTLQYTSSLPLPNFEDARAEDGSYDGLDDGLCDITSDTPSASSYVKTAPRGWHRPRWHAATLLVAVMLSLSSVAVMAWRVRADELIATWLSSRSSRPAPASSSPTTPPDELRTRDWLVAQRHIGPILMRAAFAAAAERARLDEDKADAIGAELGGIVEARIDLEISMSTSVAARARLDAALARALARLPKGASGLASSAQVNVRALTAVPTSWAVVAHPSDVDTARIRLHARHDIAAALGAEGRRAHVDADTIAKLSGELQRRLLARIDLAHRAARGEGQDTQRRLSRLDEETRSLIEDALPYTTADAVFVLWREYYRPPASGSPAPLFRK